MGQENGDQQPGGDERAAGLQDTDDPEPGYKPVRHEPAADHRAHVCDIAEADQFRRRLDDRFVVYGAPVVHGPFARHAAESDQPEQDDIGIDFPLGAFVSGRRVACPVARQG